MTATTAKLIEHILPLTIHRRNNPVLTLIMPGKLEEGRIKQDFDSFEGMQGRELHVLFEQDEIHGMSDWRQRILQGLRESRLLLACLSPAYLQSEYCEWEFVEYLKYEIGHLHGFNGVAPIYFVEVPGWESKEFEQQCAA